jgi:autotransporter adhesin
LDQSKAYTDQKTANLVSSSDFDAFKSNIDSRFNGLNTRLNRVGAMGSAMAGMAGAIAAAPGTDNRVSAAVGGYHGQGALAVGYARRIPGNGAVLVGGTVAGGGESSGTVGVSFGW